MFNNKVVFPTVSAGAAKVRTLDGKHRERLFEAHRVPPGQKFSLHLHQGSHGHKASFAYDICLIKMKKITPLIAIVGEKIVNTSYLKEKEVYLPRKSNFILQ